MIPNFYDPITVVRDGRLRHVRWEFLRGTEADSASIIELQDNPLGPNGKRLTGVGTVCIDDEGTTWCRGHVLDHSEEGKVLLAAAAMEMKPAPVRRPTHAHVNDYKPSEDDN